MHQNCLLLFDRYAAGYFTNGIRVLEIGPDTEPSAFRQALDGLDLRWETAELDEALMPTDTGAFALPTFAPTYRMASEYEIPVTAGAFDVVLAANVLEHVRQPWRWVPELARVTKPGGKVILINPISWPHHPAPYDCWRIYPDGMRALCDEAGLDILECRSESLEPLPSRRSYPHVSYDWLNQSHWKASLKGLIGWPVPTAVDLVTVAQKPAHRATGLA